MNHVRSLRRILVLGELQFVGSALVEQLCRENLELECWFLDEMIFEYISTEFHQRIFILEDFNEDSLLKGFREQLWDSVFHFVSFYSNNSDQYKLDIQFKNQLLGLVLENLESKPFYFEVESDWVYNFKEESSEFDVDIHVESSVERLKYYKNRINVETTNLLSAHMQPNHWIFNFIESLKEKSSFGVPCQGHVLRDWLFLEDYILALSHILKNGKSGERYTVVGLNEWSNYDLMLLIGSTYDRLKIKENGSFKAFLCNRELACRKSYNLTKNGLKYFSLNKSHKPLSIYEIIEDLVM